MVGFWAGAGEGFTQTFNRRRAEDQQMKAQEERDNRIAFFDRMDKANDLLARTKAQKTKAMDAAVLLAGQFGGSPNQYYKDILTFGEDTVRKDLMEGKLRPSAASKKDIESGIQQEMESSGLAQRGEEVKQSQAQAPDGTPIQTASVGTQPQEQPGILERLGVGIKKLFGITNKTSSQKTQLNKLLSDYARESGMSVEEVKDIYNRQFKYDPDIEAAEDYQGEGLIPTQPDIIDMDPKDALNNYNKYKDDRAKIEAPLDDAKNSFVSLSRDADVIAQVIKNQPEVANSALRNVSTFVEDAAYTVKGVWQAGLKSMGLAEANEIDKIKQLEASTDPADKAKARELLAKLVADQENFISRELSENASASRIVEQRLKLMAYKLGMLYQQTGRTFSEAEREMMEKIVGGGNTPEQFMNNMRQLLSGEYKQVQDKIVSGNKRMEDDLTIMNNLSKFVPGFSQLVGGRKFEPMQGLDTFVPESEAGQILMDFGIDPTEGQLLEGWVYNKAGVPVPTSTKAVEDAAAKKKGEAPADLGEIVPLPDGSKLIFNPETGEYDPI